MRSKDGTEPIVHSQSTIENRRITSNANFEIASAGSNLVSNRQQQWGKSGGVRPKVGQNETIMIDKSGAGRLRQRYNKNLKHSGTMVVKNKDGSHSGPQSALFQVNN